MAKQTKKQPNLTTAVIAVGEKVAENHALLKAIHAKQAEQTLTAPASPIAGSLPPEITSLIRELDLARKAVEKQLKFTGEWRGTLAKLLLNEQVLGNKNTTLPQLICHAIAHRNGYGWGTITLPEIVQGKQCYVLIKADSNNWSFYQQEPILLGATLDFSQSPSGVLVGVADWVEFLFLDPQHGAPLSPVKLKVEEGEFFT